MPLNYILIKQSFLGLIKLNSPVFNKIVIYDSQFEFQLIYSEVDNVSFIQ